MIKVESIVQIYEVNGEESFKEPEEIKISSHWNRDEFINIKIPGFSKLTVSARDLEAAITNAKNSSRF